MTASSPLSVLLVEEEPIARAGWGALLHPASGLTLCAEAGSPPEARQLCAHWQPGVIVVDVEMNGGEGCSLVKELRRLCPPARVVALLRRCDATWLQRVLQAGAASCVTRREGLEIFRLALQATVAAQPYLSPATEAVLMKGVAAGHFGPRRSPDTALSERERQVFGLYGQGRTTREVSLALKVSVKTVETHALHIREKLHLRTLAELRHRAALGTQPHRGR